LSRSIQMFSGGATLTSYCAACRKQSKESMQARLPRRAHTLQHGHPAATRASPAGQASNQQGPPGTVLQCVQGHASGVAQQPLEIRAVGSLQLAEQPQLLSAPHQVV
jgi:hypothetical protein